MTRAVKATQRAGRGAVGVRAPAPRDTLLDRAAWMVALATVFLVPLIVTSSTYDSYRLPKEMFVRAAGLIILALAAMRWLLFGPSPRWRPDRRWIFAGAVVGWTMVTALTAQQRTLAAESILWVAGCAVLFMTLDAGIAGRWWTLLYAVFGAAAINALCCLVAVAGWTAGYGVVNGRTVGFLGNPDDAGSYLAFVTVAAAALSVATLRRRTLHVALTVLFFAALLTTQTLGSIAAVFAGLLCLALLALGRRAVVVVAALVLVAAMAVAFYQPLHGRAEQWVVAAANGHVDDLLGDRATPFLAAWEMLKDHPLVGVGPANYRFAFFDYKLRVEAKHPLLTEARSRPYNFGDAHNDHLQTLAQTGLPGYALLLAAMVWMARRSFSSAARTTEGRFARLVSLPMVLAFAVAAMPQFPLELAGPMTTLLAVVVPATMRLDHDDAVA